MIGLRPGARFAAIGVLALALALAACGRRGPLEAPPSAALPQPVPEQPGLGAPPPDPSLAAILPEAMPAPPPSPSLAAPPPTRSFILDWLLN